MEQAANLPEGCSARPATMGDLERVVEFINEFATAVTGGNETTLEQARGEWETPSFDPGLWFIAWGGDQIAGLARGRPQANHDPEMGWIRTLSVRRPWRRKGLALALLIHSFGIFWERGTHKVGLGVDGLNPTGATGLYEKAGMVVDLQWDTFSKELRPGKELMNLGLPD